MKYIIVMIFFVLFCIFIGILMFTIWGLYYDLEKKTNEYVIKAQKRIQYLEKIIEIQKEQTKKLEEGYEKSCNKGKLSS